MNGPNEDALFANAPNMCSAVVREVRMPRNDVPEEQ
jgi:hypothetical protein